MEWDLLYIKIRDRLIAKEEALSKLKELEVLFKGGVEHGKHVPNNLLK